jgi:hypothetical protein
MESTIFQSDRADFISGRHKPLGASEAVEKIGSAEGSLLDRASQRESSRRCTNMVSGRRVTSALSESTEW